MIATLLIPEIEDTLSSIISLVPDESTFIVNVLEKTSGLESIASSKNFVIQIYQQFSLFDILKLTQLITNKLNKNSILIFKRVKMHLKQSNIK